MVWLALFVQPINVTWSLHLKYIPVLPVSSNILTDVVWKQFQLKLTLDLIDWSESFLRAQNPISWAHCINTDRVCVFVTHTVQTEERVGWFLEKWLFLFYCSSSYPRVILRGLQAERQLLRLLLHRSRWEWSPGAHTGILQHDRWDHGSSCLVKYALFTRRKGNKKNK